MSCIDYNDWIVILVNVLFFMIVQTLFFRYVASKQYETVLVDKLGLVSEYISKQKNYKRALSNERQKFATTNAQLLESQYNTRQTINNQLEIDYCWKYIVFTIVAIAIVWFVNSKPWGTLHTLGLIFVILGYTTELLFFFGMVKQYEFVGDHTIINSLVTGMFE